MATTETLTAERILATTEEVLRRHGAAKATVVDVARALGVSHAAVYRHFRTKAALREAVTKRWLDRTSDALSGLVGADGPAEDRLRRWLAGLFEAKQHKAGDDPELFATYTVLVGEASEVVDEHIADLTGQLAAILRQGVEGGEFAPCEPDATARAVFEATAHYHDPVYAPDWSRAGVQDTFTSLVDLLVRGLRP